MMGIVTSKGIGFGFETYPGRKKPALIIRNGNVDTIYGVFHNEFAATEFVKAVAKILEIKESEENDDSDKQC